MDTRALLIDLHARAHRSLTLVLDHVATLPPAVLAQEVEGFGVSTILEQLHHVFGAERYWISVLMGRTDASEREEDRASLDAVRAFGVRTTATTRAYLERRTDDELERPVACVTWKGEARTFVPLQVLLRTQTHLFHHVGQVTAMARTFGHPVPPGFDFPLD